MSVTVSASPPGNSSRFLKNKSDPASGPASRRWPVCMVLLAVGLLVSPSAAYASGESTNDAGRAEPVPRLADLVVDLGHETWSRREAAQTRLLAQRDRVTALLREALKSDNLERASRARFLLDTLDPLLGHFQIIKVRLGDPPQITAAGSASGRTREELTVEPRNLRAATGVSIPRTSFRYSVFFSALHEGGLEVSVTRALRGYSTRDTLSAPLANTSAISLLARTEECHYEEFGVHLERRRQRYLTLARVRYGRASELEDVELPAEPERLLETLVEELVAQARSGVSAAREAAVEILSYLTPGKSEEVFATALEDPALRPLAILGLDRPEALSELVVSRVEPSVAGSPKLPPPRIRAAVRLLERGDGAHLGFLVDRLTRDNPEHLHYIMAGIADFVDAHAPERKPGARGRTRLPEESRRLLTRRIFADSFFSHAVWQNRETAYFVDRMSSLLDPEVADDVTLLEESLTRLEGMVRGSSGPVRITFDVCRPIWRRLAARLPSPPSARAMLFRLLPSLMAGTSISQALHAVDDALEGDPLSDVELKTLLDTLLEYRNTNLQSSSKVLIQVLRSIRLDAGQLRPLIAATLELAEPLAAPSRPVSSSSSRSHSGLFQQIADRLRYLTGVASPRMSRDIGVWKSWLEEDTAVLDQEKRLLALEARSGSSGPLLLLAEFDLVVKDSSSSVTGRSLPSEFDLVDGRLLEVKGGEPFSYSDRWGNTVTRRLREIKGHLPRTSQSVPSRQTNRGPSLTSLANAPRRFRFDDSHLQLTVGIPSLSSMSGRDVTSVWVETSAFYLGSRSLPGRSQSSYRTITLLTEIPTERPPRESEPSSLWDWFLRAHILALPDKPSSTLVSAVSRILRALKIEGAGAVMSTIFDRQPSHQLARDLYEAFGERRGIEYYTNRLPNLVGSQRLYAAQLLAEVGELAGVDVLLEDGRRQARIHRGSLTALDRYLQLPSTPPEERTRVLDFLVGRLKFQSLHDELDLRVIFATIRREANDDFGFTTAVGTNDPQEKRVKIQKAIEDARTWWREPSSKPTSGSGNSR